MGDARFREKAEAAMKSRITGDQTVVFVSHGGQIRDIATGRCASRRAIWRRASPRDVLAAYREVCY